MKVKIIFVALILVAILGVFSVAFAQTMTEAQRQTLIAQLQAQIAALTQQINTILAQKQLQAGGSVVATGCYTFENNLGFAQSGTIEVVNLHAVLQKEGISYAPDDSSTYSTGTVEAVKQFQTKYKIVANTAGYVGATTREKLNSLYKCKVKPIDISIDNSDGPLDIFVTLGSGATVTSTGINLNKTINLKWTGVDVSSCTASDSLTPTIFSGFQPSTGSSSVNMSGVIKTTATINKISDIFKISCISTLTGSAVSDSVAVDLFYNVSSTCNPYWQVGTWSACASGKRTRTVIDANGCGTLVGKPTITETCTIATCTPLWQTGVWGSCIGGKKIRTVTDANNCGTTTGKPAISENCCSAVCLPAQADGIWAVSCSGALTKCATGKLCRETYSTSSSLVNGTVQTTQTLNGTQCYTPLCVPSWQTPTDWGECINGQQTRTVTDANNCGVTTNKPTTNQSCCSAVCLNQTDGVYALSCSGAITKCATGKTCQETFSTSTSLVNGAVQTTQKLSGTQCVTPE